MLFLNKNFSKKFIKNISVCILLSTVCNISLSDEFKDLIINGSDRINAEYLYKELCLK